jgi:uncharacterized protein YbjT (DUF2867 family)
VTLVNFDFENASTWPAALDGITTVFLLRPPHLADVPKVFVPLIQAISAAGVKHVVFLSVQGAENNSIIPHRKIELALLDSGLAWTFLRPSYFMQNLTTTLRKDLFMRKIVLPAGDAKFQWVDVLDIGRVAAVVLSNPEEHAGKAYEITGTELRSFPDVLWELGETTGVTIACESPNPISYVWREYRAGRPLGMAMVMVMLHYLPRFFESPGQADTVKRLTGREPGTIREFVEREVVPVLASSGD